MFFSTGSTAAINCGVIRLKKETETWKEEKWRGEEDEDQNLPPPENDPAAAIMIVILSPLLHFMVSEA